MTRRHGPTYPTNRPRLRKVVVLGAGMAGLASAAALAAGRAERVTVVDRDDLAAVDGVRKGVPQGGHVHLLVPGGLAALERLLPGIEHELRDAGAAILRDADDFAVHVGGGRLKLERLDPSFALVGATRPLLERVVRRRVRALQNVQVVGGVDVRGLTADAYGSIGGVRVRRKREKESEEIVPADLVVDATGRGSRADRWLAELGYEAPDEEVVRVDVRYTTRLFRRSSRRSGGARNVLIGALPGQGRGAVALAVENDRWIVTLTGLLGQQPPVELEGFFAFARSLWSRDVHALVQRERPVGDAVTGAYPANARRRYDRLRRFPTGFVVVGDALATLNPTYGQGMSVATMEAEVLGSVVDRVPWSRIGSAFFRAVRPRIDDVWTQAVDNDLRHPDVEGSRTLRWRLVDRYARRLLPVAHRDPVVGRALLDVMALRQSGSSLMRPQVAARVLLRGAPQRAGPAGQATPRRG